MTTHMEGVDFQFQQEGNQLQEGANQLQKEGNQVQEGVSMYQWHVPTPRKITLNTKVGLQVTSCTALYPTYYIKKGLQTMGCDKCQNLHN